MSTVNLANADNALKSAYLDVVSDHLNNLVNPFYAAIEHSTTDVWGKDVKKLIVTGLKGGISAGSEDGNLPSASGNKYLQFVSTLKNLYGVIEISDKAVRASENSAGAFVNLLNAEMEQLINASKVNFGRMLFSDGTGKLCEINMVSEKTLNVDETCYLLPGMKIDIMDEDGSIPEKYVGLTVRSVDADDLSFTVYEEDAIDETELLSGTVYIHGIKEGELTGLAQIFNTNGSTLYGVSRANNSYMNPFVDKITHVLTEHVLQRALDTIETRSGKRPNMILCSMGVRRALQKLFTNAGKQMPVMELAGGYNAISFNGIPIVADRFCPRGALYLLNTNDFVLHQLCDWEWLSGDDGKILKQVPGKPVYTATLVKYAELICNQPNGQGAFLGIEEE